MARRRSIRARLRRARELGLAEWALLSEAAICLALARLVLRFVPFERIGRRLGVFVSPQEARAGAAAPSDPPRAALLAARVGWAVRAAARHVPFAAVCLPQAIAARMMLQRRGVASVLHFGVAKGMTGKPFDAHAWLDAAGVEVTGFPVARAFTELGCFV
jgi:hypothetical protein